MTEKDLIIEEQRAEIKRLRELLAFNMETVKRLSKFVSDDVLGQLALEMSRPKREIKEVDEEFWRGE